MPEQFISEPIKPVFNTTDTKKMSLGSPGLPREFIWRQENIIIIETLHSWRSTGACRHGSGEQYARKHWFKVKTAKHGTMKIYFNRALPGRNKEMGWWLYTIDK